MYWSGRNFAPCSIAFSRISRNATATALLSASGKSTISRRNWISRSAVCRSLRTISRIHSGVAARRFRRQVHHFRQRIKRKWLREITERVLAHRIHHIRRRALVRQNDQTSVRPRRSQLAQQFDVVFSGSFLARQNQVEVYPCRQLQRRLSIRRVPYAPFARIQDVRQKRARRVVGINEQSLLHRNRLQNELRGGTHKSIHNTINRD